MFPPFRFLMRLGKSLDHHSAVIQIFSPRETTLPLGEGIMMKPLQS
jgi:hypothetical protein